MQISKEQQVEEQKFIEKLKTEGMEIYEIDRAPMKEMVQSVYDNFAKTNSDKYFKEIEALR